uniref:Cupin 2, conserved barrel domain protein n=1 Tax=Solibacter usitatus (strain Ellin6076) TaxID=234267 RepID=Q01XA6_SOLUE
MKLSRRQMAGLLPALAAAQTAEKKAKPVLTSKTYLYEDMPVKPNGTNATRAVFDGKNHSGFGVELHITELGPGMAPHAPHHHVNEEALMLRSGQLDVTIEGKTMRVTAGSVVYVNSNEEHGWKNPGPEKAQYFVIALGKES